MALIRRGGSLKYVVLSTDKLPKDSFSLSVTRVVPEGDFDEQLFVS